MTCRFAGCTSKLGHYQHREKHQALPHWRCSCGWVGPYPKMHVGAVVWRRGEDPADHQTTRVTPQEIEPA